MQEADPTCNNSGLVKTGKSSIYADKKASSGLMGQGKKYNVGGPY